MYVGSEISPPSVHLNLGAPSVHWVQKVLLIFLPGKRRQKNLKKFWNTS